MRLEPASPVRVRYSIGLGRDYSFHSKHMHDSVEKTVVQIGCQLCEDSVVCSSLYLWSRLHLDKMVSYGYCYYWSAVEDTLRRNIYGKLCTPIRPP